MIGILGNFNPVHNAHLVVRLRSDNKVRLDQVLLMPSTEPIPMWICKETIDEKHRLKGPQGAGY